MQNNAIPCITLHVVWNHFRQKGLNCFTFKKFSRISLLYLDLEAFLFHFSLLEIPISTLAGHCLFQNFSCMQVHIAALTTLYDVALSAMICPLLRCCPLTSNTIMVPSYESNTIPSSRWVMQTWQEWVPLLPLVLEKEVDKCSMHSFSILFSFAALYFSLL